MVLLVGMGIPFTRENASEMARRANLVRWSPENRAKTVWDAPEVSRAIPEDDYRSQRLLRVRKQLDRVDRMMMTEDDPSRLDRLASAQNRLSEQERILDGRPTPGQLKPGLKPARRQPAPQVAIEVDTETTPQPVVVQPPKPEI